MPSKKNPRNDRDQSGSESGSGRIGVGPRSQQMRVCCNVKPRPIDSLPYQFAEPVGFTSDESGWLEHGIGGFRLRVGITLDFPGRKESGESRTNESCLLNFQTAAQGGSFCNCRGWSRCLHPGRGVNENKWPTTGEAGDFRNLRTRRTAQPRVLSLVFKSFPSCPPSWSNKISVQHASL